MNKNKLVCICGMPGSGKSVVADFFVEKGFQFFRFGQAILDVLIKKGMTPNERNQKKVREEIRLEHGMEAMAKLNLDNFDALLKKGNVVADGLYSWSEYKLLKQNYKDQFIVIAIYAPPELRYERISKRKSDKNYKDMRNHEFTKEEAKARDYNEIENTEKGGPIAMADFTLLNTSDIKFLKRQLSQLYRDNFK